MSYYHRALEHIEGLEAQLVCLEDSGHAEVRLAVRGLLKTVRECKEILAEWRYEPDLHRARQETYLHLGDDKDNED